MDISRSAAEFDMLPRCRSFVGDAVMAVRLDSVERAITEIKAGKPVIVIDGEDRENEGDLTFAAELATSEVLAFMVRYTSGFVCVALNAADADRLPPIFHNQDPHGPAYAVTVDMREGISTGISARDRALTIRALADPSPTPPRWLGTSLDPATSWLYVPRTAACCAVLGTPRLLSISPFWPDFIPRACGCAHRGRVLRVHLNF
jgi:hypothetical protein